MSECIFVANTRFRSSVFASSCWYPAHNPQFLRDLSLHLSCAGKILPFQQLAHRKRKDVEEGTVTVAVCLYAFDILFLNGESLLKVPSACTRNKPARTVFHADDALLSIGSFVAFHYLAIHDISCLKF
jgi:hypothetical protein